MNPDIDHMRRELWHRMINQIKASPFLQEILGLRFVGARSIRKRPAGLPKAAGPTVKFRRRKNVQP